MEERITFVPLPELQEAARRACQDQYGHRPPNVSIEAPGGLHFHCETTDPHPPRTPYALDCWRHPGCIEASGGFVLPYLAADATQASLFPASIPVTIVLRSGQEQRSERLVGAFLVEPAVSSKEARTAVP